MIVDIRTALITGGVLLTAVQIGQSAGTALTVLAGHRREVPR